MKKKDLKYSSSRGFRSSTRQRYIPGWILLNKNVDVVDI